VNKGLLNQASDPLKQLPHYMCFSENYYRKSWRFSSVRRLKNIICFLEWVPDVQQLGVLDEPIELSPEQQSRLKQVFSLYAVEDSNVVSGHQLHTLCKALDLDQDEEDELVKSQGDHITIDQMRQQLTSQALFKVQKGRYFIALCLEEAEHLRAAMHAHMKSKTWPATSLLALRCVGNAESMLRDSVLDVLAPGDDMKSESSYQVEAATQCLRFVNCALGYDTKQLHVLLLVLQHTDVKSRKPWWIDVRSAEDASKNRSCSCSLQGCFAKRCKW